MLNFRKRGCSSLSWERQNTPGGTFWPTLFPTSTCPISRELFSWWKTLDLPGRHKHVPNEVKVSLRRAEFGLLLWNKDVRWTTVIDHIQIFASAEIKKLVYIWWMWAVLAASHIESLWTQNVAGAASRTRASATAGCNLSEHFTHFYAKLWIQEQKKTCFYALLNHWLLILWVEGRLVGYKLQQMF